MVLRWTLIGYMSVQLNIYYFWLREQASIKIQAAFRSCHKELFYLRKHKRYIQKFVVGREITCPIGLETIKTPVLWNGHLYEKENLTKWCEKNGQCPLTRTKNGPIIDYLKLSQFIEEQWALKELLEHELQKLKKRENYKVEYIACLEKRWKEPWPTFSSEASDSSDDSAW